MIGANIRTENHFTSFDYVSAEQTLLSNGSFFPAKNMLKMLKILCSADGERASLPKTRNFSFHSKFSTFDTKLDVDEKKKPMLELQWCRKIKKKKRKEKKKIM